MAPVHLQGALTSPCARGALHQTHGAPCAFSITSQLPHERGVPKETLLPSSSRSCEPPLSTPSALRLGPALKTPIWKSPETFGVTRSVRRTKPHTTTSPTAHSQRSARHRHRDPSFRTINGRHRPAWPPYRLRRDSAGRQLRPPGVTSPKHSPLRPVLPARDDPYSVGRFTITRGRSSPCIDTRGRFTNTLGRFTITMGRYKSLALFFT